MTEFVPSAGASIGNLNRSAGRDYPSEEWRITRQLVRMIATATRWQDIVEASDAIFHVEIMAKAMREEQKQHEKAETERKPQGLQLCLGDHRWIGSGDSCCPECGRRPSASAQYVL